MADRRDGSLPTRTPPWVIGSPQAETLGLVEPSSPDAICEYVNTTCWKAWLPAHRAWHKQVEENVRMVSGRQFEAFIETFGEFVDVGRYYATPDDRWRENPVFNWLAHYYKLTLSKLTENVPGIGFLPSGADYKDAILAQVMEPIWKYQWTQMEMAEKMFPLYAWVILAARAITKMRWDPDRGPAEDYRGPAIFEQFTNNVLTRRMLSDAPYTKNGDGAYVPAFVYGEDGQPMVGEDGEPQFGAPYSSRLGDLDFDVLTPTSLIEPVGPDPFHRKPWYTQDLLMDVDDIKRRYGVELEPEDISGDDDLHLQLAYATQFGMPSSYQMASSGHIEPISLKGKRRIREHWRRDLPNDPLLSRGRLIVVTANGPHCLYDDINPFWVQGSHEQVVMPFEAYDAIPFPARHSGGMGDLESMNPLQRALNRRMGGAMAAVDHLEQPITIYNDASISEEDVDHFNEPGAYIPGSLNAGLGAPLFRLPAADLPRGSMDMATVLQTWMQTLGSLPLSAEGVPQTTDPSGELQRELRFDVDRTWGATLRLHSYIWARQADKMGGILAACMDDRRLLVLSGEDNAPEFVQVAPEMFSGRVNAVPHPESMVLESRQEKQNRIFQLMSMGLPPDLGFQMLNYPDLNRLLRPGGPAYSLALQENLEMMLGQFPMALPEQDHQVHLLVHKKQMQTLAYRDAGPELQQVYRLHVMMHEEFGLGEAVRQAGMANVAAAATGAGPAANGKPGSSSQTAGAPGASTSGRAPSAGDLSNGARTPGGADPRRALASR